VVQTSKVPIEDLPKPVVYICQADQFNQTNAESFGYNLIKPFLEGMLIGRNTTSWHGKDGNLTYKELESIIFDYDYTKLQLIGDYGGSQEYVFMPPHGICLKLRGSKSSPIIWLLSKQKVNIIFADPYRENYIWTQQFSDAKTTIGPSFKKIYEQVSMK
jgi:hypothetical protein